MFLSRARAIPFSACGYVAGFFLGFVLMLMLPLYTWKVFVIDLGTCLECIITYRFVIGWFVLYAFDVSFCAVMICYLDFVHIVNTHGFGHCTSNPPNALPVSVCVCACVRVCVCVCVCMRVCMRALACLLFLFLSAKKVLTYLTQQNRPYSAGKNFFSSCVVYRS